MTNPLAAPAPDELLQRLRRFNDDYFRGLQAPVDDGRVFAEVDQRSRLPTMIAQPT